MADGPKPLRKGAYIDRDTSDAFLDGPQPLHTYDGKARETTWDDIDRRLQQGVEGPKLPTDWASKGD